LKPQKGTKFFSHKKAQKAQNEEGRIRTNKKNKEKNMSGRGACPRCWGERGHARVPDELVLASSFCAFCAFLWHSFASLLCHLARARFWQLRYLFV
jgi:hypothetical protein